MALDVRIIAGVGGTTYYLVNSSGSPTAGGAATGVTTTPYSLNAAQWTQTAAQRQITYAGGPPFGIGARPLYAGFSNVTETVEIGIAANSADNAASLLRQLRQILNQALYSFPAILYWKPNGATNPAYFEVYSADVQEVGDWQNPAAGFTTFLTRVTWTRSPFGGRLSSESAETLINAVSFQSRFSGTPDCFDTYATGTGDLVYDGQPLNLTLSNTSGSTLSNWLMATSRTPVVTATTQTLTTNSTTGATASYATAVGITPAAQLNFRQGLRLRLLAQTTAATTGSQMRIVVSTLDPNLYATYPTAGEQIVYRSPWFTSSNAAQMVDCGTVPTSFLVETASYTLYLVLQVRSPSGAFVTVTLSNFVYFLYFEVCRSAEGFQVPNGSSISLISYNSIAGVIGIDRPLLPIRRPVMYSGIATGPVIGAAPRYHDSLLLTAIPLISYPPSNSVAYVTTATYTATAQHAPLYYTLRGNG